jgi:hypothetical protein
MILQRSVVIVSCVAATALGGHSTFAQTAQPLAASGLVPAAVLQPLLPAPDGWKKESDDASQVAMSPTCTYTFASATYAKDAMRVKITLADTGKAEDGLLALAAMVVSLPDDYTEKIPPATIVTRLKIAGSPAAEHWNGTKQEGEITVLVSGRFVVSLEGSHLDGPETLRGLVQQVDLKKLAELK